MGDENKRTYHKKIWFWFIGVASIIFILLGGFYEPSSISRIMTTAVISNISTENYIKDKTYKVGTDIKAGEYVIISDGGSVSASKISYTNNIAIEIIENRIIITVVDGQTLTIRNGTLFPISNAPAVVKVDGKIPAGMYKIGVDLPEGTYTIRSYDDNKACQTIISTEADYITNDLYNRKTIPSTVSTYTFIGEKSLKVLKKQYLWVSNGYIVAK